MHGGNYMSVAKQFMVLVAFAMLCMLSAINLVSAFNSLSCDTTKEGLGFGSVYADCSCSPPRIGLWASDTTAGSHTATGFLRDEISVKNSGSYQIYIKGSANGRLGILGVPGTNFLGARSDINVFAKVYNAKNHDTVYGGEEAQLYIKVAQDYFWDTNYNDKFDKYFTVNLDANKKYIIELRAVASDKSLGPVTVVSDWGAKPPSLRDNFGISWIEDTIVPLNQPPQNPPTTTNPNEEGTTDAEAWYNKGNALLIQYKYTDALPAFKRAIELNPNYALAWYNEGICLDYQEKFDDAIQAYDRAIELDPTFAAAWSAKGDSLQRLSRLDDAIQDYNKALELNPMEAYPSLAKAKVLDDLGKHEEATEAFDKATEINPGYWAAWYFKGMHLYDLGNYEDAIKTFDKAIELNQKDDTSCYYKGLAFIELGNYEDAIKTFAKAIELNQKVPYYWYNKGIALKAVHSDTEADAAFVKAKELGYTG